MRVSLEREVSGQRGWSNFLGKLIEVMREIYDVKIVPKDQKSDVHLSIISGHKKGSKNVVRIDGVYYDTKRLVRNNSIRNSLETADGVVFQSEWCRVFATTMLKTKPKKSAVIWNGVDQQEIARVKPKKDLGYEQTWMCCAHWRVNKRPDTIARAFIEAREKTGKNIGMFFLGGFKDENLKVKYKHIHYLNEVPHDQLYEYFVAGDWMCHICHVDSCPNSVIEGLSCGLPVLCNNIGGTPEITGDSGLIVKLDKPFSFEVLSDWNETGSRNVNVTTLADGMVEMMNKTWTIQRPDLDIRVSAKKYYEFFIKLLES